MRIEEIKSKGEILRVIRLTQLAYKFPLAGKLVIRVRDDVNEMINSLDSGTLKIFSIYDLGELYASVRCTLDSNKKEINFSKLAVHPEFRRLGLATKLINYLEDWAKRNDYQEVNLLCIKEEKGLPKFYKNLGYRLKKEIGAKNEKGKNSRTEVFMLKKL